jgi:hypothetical protein
MARSISGLGIVEGSYTFWSIFFFQLGLRLLLFAEAEPLEVRSKCSDGKGSCWFGIVMLTK